VAPLTAALARRRPSPLASGRPATWAAAVLSVIARANFLFDKTQVPHCTPDELAKACGVSHSAAAAKARRIEDPLDIVPMDPRWTPPSRLRDNPLVWLIEVNGVVLGRNPPGSAMKSGAIATCQVWLGAQRGLDHRARPQRPWVPDALSEGPRGRSHPNTSGEFLGGRSESTRRMGHRSTGPRDRILVAAFVTVLLGGCAGLAPGVEAPGVTISRIELTSDVAIDSLGADFPTVDGACHTVGFSSAGHIYVTDLARQLFRRVTVNAAGGAANQRSGIPKLSADATQIAFDSAASNLVPGKQNRHDHVFLRNLETWSIVRVTQSPEGEQANDASIAFDGSISLSRDGRFVAFASYASNLVPGDTNERVDAFVRDIELGSNERVSVASSGEQGEGNSAGPTLSGDASRVAFFSEAANLVPEDANGVSDVFIRDRIDGTIRRISLALDGSDANGPSDVAMISADGRSIAFASDASNLVPDDANQERDVFVHDLESGRTERISEAADGSDPDGASDFPSISADGRRVAFVSRASNLVPDDRNSVPDVFVADVAGGWVIRVSVAFNGTEANEESGAWGIELSDDGRCVVFGSFASNLVEGDDNARPDVFVAEIR
jgi:Tol biopolymer transport system component